ncbi:uncharacterized protein LOC143037277 [Oratosquilla oratoria]|uniref:uncharacterized protein LOC143037277 n=1 Tax=Oratosquilla oratoria TaxID=337810 RepID=UPI003F762B99
MRTLVPVAGVVINSAFFRDETPITPTPQPPPNLTPSAQFIPLELVRRLMDAKLHEELVTDICMWRSCKKDSEFSHFQNRATFSPPPRELTLGDSSPLLAYKLHPVTWKQAHTETVETTVQSFFPERSVGERFQGLLQATVGLQVFNFVIDNTYCGRTQQEPLNMRGVSNLGILPRSSLLLVLLLATDAVYSICVFKNKKGWSLDCGMRDTYLFRLKDVGGIKAKFDFGLGFGDEDGFKHSISHTSGHHHAHRKEDHVEESGDADQGFPYEFEKVRRPGMAPPRSNRVLPKTTFGGGLLRLPEDSTPPLGRVPPLPLPREDLPTRSQPLRRVPVRRHHRAGPIRRRAERPQQKKQSFWSWLWSLFFSSETTEAPPSSSPTLGQDRVAHPSMRFVENPRRHQRPHLDPQRPHQNQQMQRQFISTGNVDGREVFNIPGTNRQVVVVREPQPTPAPTTPRFPTVGPSMAQVLQFAFKNPSDHQQVSSDTPSDTDHVPSFAAKMFVVREAPKELYPPGYKAPSFFPVVDRKVQQEAPRL